MIGQEVYSPSSFSHDSNVKNYEVVDEKGTNELGDEQQEKPPTPKPFIPLVSFFGRLKRQKMDKQFSVIYDMLSKVTLTYLY